jgi:hypothetical protein
MATFIVYTKSHCIPFNKIKQGPLLRFPESDGETVTAALGEPEGGRKQRVNQE